jgi:PAS domain S-box-containing protein
MTFDHRGGNFINNNKTLWECAHPLQTTSRMFQVLTCLTVEHDWRLVVLAGCVCFLASAAAISLFQRVRATKGRERLVWLSLDAVAAGYGIWATHFIGILAYDPGIGAGYNLTLTILSLLVAVAISGAGFALATADFARWVSAAGGAVFGLGIAAMHFTGMLALDLPGYTSWSPNLVVAAVALGIALGAFALVVAARRTDTRSTLIAAVLLALAVFAVHFTAMGAVSFVPDPTRILGTASLSPTSLSLIVAVTAAILLGMCLVAALSDRQSKDKLKQQKLLLDAALENMSQGLCMYDAEGRIVMFNERYAEMMGVSAASLKGRSLLDHFKRLKASGDFAEDPEEFFARVIARIREGRSSSEIVEASAGRTLRVLEQPMQGGGWVATFEDITEWRRAQARISYMARHDALTHLANRTLFHEQLTAALGRTTRDEKVAVLCLDLDHFKDVNDSMGHPVGDDLLREVNLMLSDIVGSADGFDEAARKGCCFRGLRLAVYLDNGKLVTSEPGRQSTGARDHRGGPLAG